jgi:predicted DNA-binding protein
MGNAKTQSIIRKIEELYIALDVIAEIDSSDETFALRNAIRKKIEEYELDMEDELERLENARDAEREANYQEN